MELGEAIETATKKMDYDNIRPEQLKVLESFLKGRDTFVCLPTGYGKSLCYQILPYIFDYMRGKSSSFVLVVSPLTALVEDQIQLLSKRNVPATSMTIHKGDKSAILHGGYKIIYTSPELLLRDSEWRDIVVSDTFQDNIVGFIIDEAHCVKTWLVL